MRNKSLIYVIIAVSILIIAFGIYFINDITNVASGEKEVNTVNKSNATNEGNDTDSTSFNPADKDFSSTDSKSENPGATQTKESKTKDEDTKPEENPNLNGQGSIAGTVFYFRSDDDGNKYGSKMLVEGALVRLMDDINKSMGLPKEIAQIATDAEGNFEFNKIPTGQYILQIEKEGFAVKQTGKYKIKQAEIYHVEIELGKGLEVWGTVKNENDEKIANAYVVAIKIMPEQVFFEPVTTNEDGEYRISGISAGQYFFEVEHDDYANLKVMCEVSGSQQKDFVMQLGGGIRGKVTTPAGAPADNFSVKAYEYGDMMTSFSSKLSTMSKSVQNADGMYEVSNLKPGNYTLEVYSKQYARALVSKIVVEQGKFTEVNVILEEGATLKGQVLEKDTNKPVAGARVALAQYVQVKMGRNEFEQINPAMDSDSAEFATTTDEEGNFELTGLPRLRREVRVTHSDYPQVAETLDFKAAKDIVKTFYLETDTARIHGVVKDARGEPCVGYMVKLSVDMNMFGSKYKAKTNDEGFYEIDNITPGSYVIFVSQSVFSFQEISSVKLKSGDDIEVNFGIDGGVIVSGDVTLKGEKVKNAMIVFTPKDPKGQIRTGNSNENGHYEIGGISPGKYSILVVTMNFRNSSSCKFSTTVPNVEEYTFNIDFPLSTLKGKVFDAETQKPIKGAQIFLEDIESSGDAQSITELISIFSGTGNTNSEGEFEIKNLAPVKYHIRITKNGYASKIIKNFEIRENFDAVLADVYLENQLKVTGIVKDEDGNPIANAQLSVKDSEGRSLTMIFGPSSKEDGKFELGGLYEGKFVVTAKAPGYQNNSKSFTVYPEQTPEVVIVLTGGCTLNVEVTDIDGNGISNAIIELKDSKGNSITPNFFISNLNSNLNPYLTNASGRASRDSLKPGTYTLVITKTGFAKYETKISVNRDYPTDFNATMTPE